MSEQRHAAQYPTLHDVFPSQRHLQVVALGHTEDRRTEIVETHGLPMLAIQDQMVRALLELNIDNATDAQSAYDAIDAALAFFKFRGFLKGQSPSPKRIKKAMQRIAVSMGHIESDLNLLMMARRDIGIGEQERADSILQMQHAILGSIAAHVLPTSLSSKFSDDEIADSMPSVEQSFGKSGFKNDWTHGFARVAHIAQKLANTFAPAELSKPPRNHDIHFTRFIGHLGDIYERWTGLEAHAPDRNANQESDWRGPFSRFVAAVWPLTAEGSGGFSGNRHCPTNKKIREALKQSSLLQANP